MPPPPLTRQSVYDRIKTGKMSSPRKTIVNDRMSARDIKQQKKRKVVKEKLADRRKQTDACSLTNKERN